jgi:DNA mismatch repair ATPase MutL
MKKIKIYLFYIQRQIWNNVSGTILIINNIYENNKLRSQILEGKQNKFINEITEFMQSFTIINANIKKIISTIKNDNTMFKRISLFLEKILQINY